MIEVTDDPLPYAHRQAHLLGLKRAADETSEATPAYNMSGLLYLSESSSGEPWALLTVPNALVRGVFDGMHEPGIELPPNGKGRLDAHISVMRPEEIASLGGAKAIENDRGKPFKYSLGRLVSLEPAGWKEMERAWMIRVHSPELQALRRSHGLSSLPNDGKFDFHITVAVRRKGVLGRNDKAKETAPA